MTQRQFGTCFFEQYAQVSLSALLGREYDDLVNRDRPDLQSHDGHTLGIEVTRAMEESRLAHLELLQDVAGVTPAGHGDAQRILDTGYGYGLHDAGWVGLREYSYWSMALPLRRIIASKVSKVGNGFYGRFERMGLFVFSRDNLGPEEAARAMEYTASLQKGMDCRYNRLFLADVDDLFVCNLDRGEASAPDERMTRHPVSQEQRRAFYAEALRRQAKAEGTA